MVAVGILADNLVGAPWFVAVCRAIDADARVRADRGMGATPFTFTYEAQF